MHDAETSVVFLFFSDSVRFYFESGMLRGTTVMLPPNVPPPPQEIRPYFSGSLTIGFPLIKVEISF